MTETQGNTQPDMDAKAHRSNQTLDRAVDSALLVTLIFALSWAGVGTLLAIAGAFSGWLVLAGAAGVTVMVWRWSRKYAASVLGVVSYGKTAMVTVFVILGSWASLNVANPGEHLWTGRDGGTYLATAGWLARSGHLLIEARTGPYSTAEDLEFSVPGFYDLREDGRLVPQFLHAYPAMLATIGDLAGLRAMLSLNTAIGFVGLLLVFVVTSRLLGPAYALIAVVIVGASQIFTYFTRAPFSEPLAMMFLLGGVWVALLAQSASSERLWLLAGAVLGASFLARIDSLVALIPLLGLAVIARKLRHADHDHLYAALRGSLWVVTLAVVDLAVIVPHYAGQLREELLPIVAVIGATVIVGRLPESSFRFGQRILSENRRVITMIALIVVGGLLAYATFLRPEVSPSRGAPYGLQPLQEAAGMEVDPTRNYAELSVAWLTWYLGPFGVAAGFLGLGILAQQAMLGRWRRAETLWLAITAVFTAGYLWKPSINPDHMWAMRRFLPIVLPGLAIGSAATIAALGRWRPRRLLPVLGAIAVVAGLLSNSIDTLGTHELEGLAEDFIHGCDQLGTDAAVLVVNTATVDIGARTVQGFRSFCGVPAAAIGEDMLSANRLAELSVAWASEGRTLYVVARPTWALPTGMTKVRTFSFLPQTYEVLESTLLRRPTAMVLLDLRLEAVEVLPDQS